MDSAYPILLFATVLVGFVITNLIVIHIVGPRKQTVVKQMPYESGMDPIGDARQPFDVKFYLVAILFLVFDVETVFLMPWAIQMKELAVFGFIEFGLFLFLLLFGYGYIWSKGALTWE